jgi:UDPglucose--hexose-1-phosphate uridylyltransferase
MPELRKDPVTGRWVILSAERALRPYDFGTAAVPRTSQPCPFCPGNEAETPREICALRPGGGAPDGPGWTLRVVPNRFPALATEGELDRRGEGLYDRMNGVGAHEVIIETPHHDRDLPSLEEDEVAAVLRVFRERMADLHGDLRIRYVLVFENRGAAAGASLEHPHAQLIATPMLPRQVQEELDGALRYFELKERCVFCDILERETGPEGQRLVLASEGYVVLQPFAARFPFETWILPLAHASAFERGGEAQDRALARVLQATLRRLSRVVPRPAYNFVIHTAPCRSPELEHYHWHIEILPKLVAAAGFEWGSGFYINPKPPEEAAEELRLAGSALSAAGA